MASPFTHRSHKPAKAARPAAADVLAAPGKGDPTAAPATTGQVFYIVRDSDGSTHLVDRELAVPVGARVLKKFTIPGLGHSALPGRLLHALPANPATSKALEIVSRVLPGGAAPKPLPVVPMAVGVAFLIAALVLFRAVRRMVMKLCFSLVAMGLLGSGYLSWLSKHPQLASAIKSPTEIIDSAHETAEKLRQSVEAEHKALDAIDADSHR